VAHTYNPSYSGGKDEEDWGCKDEEDWGSKAGQANSSRDPISKKNPSQKRAGGVAQGIGPEFKPQYYKIHIYVYVFIYKHINIHTHTYNFITWTFVCQGIYCSKILPIFITTYYDCEMRKITHFCTLLNSFKFIMNITYLDKKMLSISQN
jgi:hypothetical protein